MKRPALLQFVLLCAVVAVAHGLALRAGLLNFDDDRLYYDNPVFRQAPLDALLHIVHPARTIADAYLPASHLSLWCDWLLFRLNPVGVHLHSLLLHMLTAWGLCCVLARLGVSRWPALLGALVFAVHPATAESVAWASSRKDVLSGLCAVLTLLCALRAARRGRAWWAVAGLCALLAFYSKGTTLVLPALVFLALWHQGAARRTWPAVASLALLAGLATAHHLAIALQSGAAGSGDRELRLLALPGTLLHYLRTAVWPAHLDVLYPTRAMLDAFAAALGPSALYLLALLLVLAVLVRYGLRGEALGLLWFGAALLPFNGVVPQSSIAVADRYLYLPLPGLAVLVAMLVKRLPWSAIPFLGAATVLAVLCVERVAVFQGSESLWRASLAVGGPRPEAAFNLGVFLLERDGHRNEAALGLLQRAATEASQPVHRLRAERLLGALALEDGNLPLAVAHGMAARSAARELPASPLAAAVRAEQAVELALLHRQQGDQPAADALLAATFAELPGHPTATAVQVAWALEAARAAVTDGQPLDGRSAAMVALRGQLDAALLRAPDDLHANLVLGDWLRATGGTVEALRQYYAMQRRWPERPEPWLRAGDLFEESGLLRGALAEIERGMGRIGPAPELLRRRGLLLAALGELADARRMLEDFLRMHPSEPTVQRALGSVLITEAERRMGQDDPRVLQSMVQRGAALDPRNPRLPYLQGWLCRTRGEFSEAVRLLDQARRAWPQDLEVARAHGEALKGLGLDLLLHRKRDEALQVFRQVVALDLPEFDLGTIPGILDEERGRLCAQGIAAMEQGEVKASLQALRAAQELVPDHEDVLFPLGVALLESGEPAEAALRLAKAEQQLRAHGRDFGLARYYRVTALKALGETPRALELAEEFLVEYPQSQMGERLRGVVTQLRKG